MSNQLKSIDKGQNYLDEFTDQAANDAKNKSHFKLIKVGEMESKPIEWLIRDLIESNSLAAVFGDPGCAKSFLAIDAACCISTGTDFHNKAVKQTPVIYIAGEGHNGIKRRFDGWSKHHGISLDDAPLYVSTSPTALCDENAVDDIVQAVEDASEGMKPGLVILDTLARNFGSGDENDTKDMTKFIAAADRIRTQYSCTVMFVHHTGHADKKRARGSMAFKGALDAEYKMTKSASNIITFEATKMKDADEPLPMAFKLCSVELPIHDDEGKPVTSAVLTNHDFKSTILNAAACKGKNQNLALDTLNELFDEYKKYIDDSDGSSRPMITVTQWRDKCFEKKLDRKRWPEVYQSLIEKCIVEIKDGFLTIK